MIMVEDSFIKRDSAVSTMASLMASQILSGWPAQTDSLVKSRVFDIKKSFLATSRERTHIFHIFPRRVGVSTYAPKRRLLSGYKRANSLSAALDT